MSIQLILKTCVCLIVSLALPASAKANITVTCPNSSESWLLGSPHRVSWADPNFDMLSGFNQTHYTVEVTDNIGTVFGEIDSNIHMLGFAWNVGALDNGAILSAGTNYHIRVTERNSGEWGMSEQSFTILPATIPQIAVLTPNGSESFRSSETIHISWTSVGSQSYPVGLYLTAKDEFGGDYIYERIIQDASNTGGFDWVIPTSIETGLYRMRAVVNPEAKPAIADFTTSTPFVITQVLPEPGSASLLGIIGLALRRRKSCH